MAWGDLGRLSITRVTDMCPLLAQTLSEVPCVRASSRSWEGSGYVQEPPSVEDWQHLASTASPTCEAMF